MFTLFITGGNTYAIHETAPAETQKIEEEGEIVQPVTVRQAVSTYTIQALINILQKKGIITEKELMKEVDKLKQGK
jgi:hypothetical protein